MSRRTRVLLLLALAAAGAGYHFLGGEGSAAADEAPAVRPWELLGCWEVRLTTWTETPDADSAGGRRRSSGTTQRGSGPGAGRTRSVPAAVEPPGVVMLLADSADLWGRVRDSYRAVPMDGAEASAPAGRARGHVRSLRWLTSADTLWVLWSTEGTRAGAALVRDDDRMRGRARGLADSLDVSAGAEAWPVNCATLEREPAPPAWRRR